MGDERGALTRLRIVLLAVPALALLVALGAQAPTVALAVAGLGGVLAALVVLIGRAPSRSRRGAVLVLAIGGVGVFLGGTALAAPLPHGTGAVVPREALQQRLETPRTTARATPLAAAALAELPVKGPAPMTGYDRTERFGPAWSDVDRNGCDTRNDVLRRDLVDRRETRCRVLAGVLHDPYTGTTIHFVRGPRTSEAVQIDHVVALADAWRTGAQRLPEARRIALANDPVNLLAVDGPVNQRKGDGDAATWLPKRKAFRCTYVAHQIAVKRAYDLWVVPAERSAMRRVLAKCPEQRLPAGAGSVARAATVTAGAFCAPEGGTGRSTSGTALVCRAGAGDDRARWRAPR
ncbi:HNH endonuclease family protein [Amnibacterium endophyticum]|uniref:HNH endonuclease family protein n=1 Tax=Amnibacterium endophyticum TaxID=2109337 RepID=A0ABW4LJJ8_9MICO